MEIILISSYQPKLLYLDPAAPAGLPKQTYSEQAEAGPGYINFTLEGTTLFRFGL